MVFCGCSFTHGHGLWQYFDIHDNQPDEFVGHLRAPHLLSKNSIRFARLVANHFNSYEIVRDDFSGDDENTLGYINQLFQIDQGVKYPFYYVGNQPMALLDYSDISHVIIQTSFPDRCPYIIDTNTKERFQLTDLPENEQLLKLEKWGIKDFDEYYKKLVNQYYNELKNIILFLESKGVKCYLLSITDDYYNILKNDTELNNKYIKILHNNLEFNTINDLFSYDKTFRIKHDYEFFGDNPPADFHPSKKCHQVIANSIINKIKNYG